MIVQNRAVHIVSSEFPCAIWKIVALEPFFFLPAQIGLHQQSAELVIQPCSPTSSLFCARTSTSCVYMTKQKPGLKAGTGETMLKRLENAEEALRLNRDQEEAMIGRLLALEAWRDAMIASEHQRQHRGDLSVDQPPRVQKMLSVQNDPPLFIDPSSSSMNGIVNPDYPGPPPPQHYNVDSPIGQPTSNTHIPHRQHSRGYLDPAVVYNPPEPQHSYPPLQPLDNNNLADQFDPSHNRPIFQIGHSLPRDDIVYSLIDTYFEHVAPWAFISIRRPEVDFQERPWSILVHAMVAISLRFSSDPRIKPFEDQIYQAARKHVWCAAMDNISLEILQALALLSLDTIGSGKGPEAWTSLAIVIRYIVTMDLHKESELNPASRAATPAPARMPSALSKTTVIPPARDWAEEESARRLFWLVYALDRYTASATGAEPAISSSDIKRRLPCADSLWLDQDRVFSDNFVSPVYLFGRPISSLMRLHPSAFFVEALDLLGRANTLQVQSIDLQNVREMEARRSATASLCACATRWYLDIIPVIGELHSDVAITPIHLMTHSLYHTTILKLQGFHAFPAFCTTGAVEPYASTCLRSARAICDLAVRVTAFANPPISPIFIWSCWVAARVFFVSSCLGARISMEKEFAQVVGALAKMARYWDLAGESPVIFLFFFHGGSETSRCFWSF